MPVVRAEEAARFDGPGTVITSLGSPSRGTRELIVFRGRFERAAGIRPHTHDHEEVFVVIRGTFTGVLDGREHPLSEGDTFIVPANTLHEVTNAGESGAEALVAMPAGTRAFGSDGQELSPPWLR